MLSYLSKEDIQDIDKQRQKLAQEAREQANNRGSTGTHGLPGGKSGAKDLPAGKQSYSAQNAASGRLSTGRSASRSGTRHALTAGGATIQHISELPEDVARAFRGEKIDLSGAKQLQSEKSTVSKVLSDPMYYAEKVMSKPLDVVQSGVKDLFGGTKKQEERLAANKQMQAAEKPSIGKAVEGTLVKGADFTASSVTSTLDWLLGNAMKELGWENNPISKLNEFTQKTKEANAEYYAKNLENGTDAQKKLDEYGTMVAAAIPQAVIAYLSAGTSAGAQSAGMLAKGGTQLAGAEAAAAASTAAAGQTVKNVATAMAKDPNYWTAFASVAGDSYQQAKEDGANDWEANMYALANGLLNAAVEVGGGIQTLPVELKAGKRGVRAWIRSMADEGKEEVVQGVIERALQNLTYGKGNRLLSTKDENAVLNPVTAAKEFAGGAVVGGVLGGGQMLADAAINRGARALPTGKQSTTVKGLPYGGEETSQNGMNATEQSEMPGEQLFRNDRVSDTVGAVAVLRENIHQIEEMEPVATVEGTEIQGNEKATDRVMGFLKKIGGKVTRPGFGDVLFSKSKVKNSLLGHGFGEAKVELFASVPAVIQSGKQINYTANWKGRGYDSYMFAAPVEYRGETAYVTAIVIRDNANRYYLHEAVDQDGNVIYRQKESPDIASDRSGENSQSTVADTELSNETITQEITESNENLQKGGKALPGGTVAQTANPRGLPTGGTQVAESREQKAQRAKEMLDAGMDEQEVYRQVWMNGEKPSGQALDQEISANAAAERVRKETAEASNEKDAGSPALNKLGVKIVRPIVEVRDATVLVQQAKAAKKAEKQLEKKIESMNATEAEKEFARGIANGTYTEKQIPKGMSENRVIDLAGYYKSAQNYIGQQLGNIKREAKRTFDVKLERLFENSDQKVVPKTLFLNLNTMERNIIKIFGEKEGRPIVNEIIQPVLQNSAERNRFINRMFDRVRGFKLTDMESELVQRVMEGNAAADQVSKLDPDMKTRIKAVAESKDIDTATAEMNIGKERIDLAKRYKQWLETQALLKNADAEKITKAAKAYQEAFDDFYAAINDFLVNHGFEPIGFIQGYAPHLQPDKAKEGLSGVLQRIGIDTEVSVLPTEIAGRTDTFRPDKQWNPYFLQREGNGDVQYDIVKGYESYVNYMANVLYHTDDIMKLRETSNFLRGKYAPDTIKEMIQKAKSLLSATTEEKTHFLQQVNRVEQGTKLTAEQADAAMDKYIDSLYDDIKKMTKYGDFVTVLENYTNKLAEKQTKLDHGIEQGLAGRRFLNLGNKLTKIFGQSTIVGNLSSALNQTAQIPTLISEVGLGNVGQALQDIATGETKVGDWEGASDFLTGKRGIDYLSESKGFEKAMDIASIPFEAVDDFASTLIVRAKYLQEVRNGASHEDAMKSADEYANRLVGSRIQGAKPMIFENKNVFTKALTTFQLEVANWWAHITQDLPMEYQAMAKEQGKLAAAKKFSARFMKGLLAAFLMNRLSEWLYGGTPAPFDVIGVTMSSIGAGKGLSTNEYMLTILDNALEEMTGERKLGTKELKSGFDAESAAKQFGYMASGDVPFLNNALSAVGASDSNLPLPKIPTETIGDAMTAIFGEDSETRKTAAKNLAEDAPKELKTWLPMGNQLYKTGKGIEALARGGAYSGYGEGEKLKYPIETGGAKGLLTGAQAILFGPNATESANSFYASGDRSLSAKQTEAYKKIVETGEDKTTVYQTMQTVRSIEDDDYAAEAKAKRDAIREADLSDNAKREIYSAMIGEGRNNDFREMQRIAMSWDQIMDMYDTWDELNRADGKTASEKATSFASVVDESDLTELQKQTVKKKLAFYTAAPASTDNYDSFTDAGITPRVAKSIAAEISNLEPEEGKESITALQKYNAVLSMGLSDSEESAAIRAMMTDSIAEKFDACTQYSVSAKQYVEAYEKMTNLKESREEKSISQKTAKAVIDSMSELTTEQKAVLWQIQNKSWKGSSNPYSKYVGNRVYAYLNAEEKGTSGRLPGGTSSGVGALGLPK